MEVNKKQFFTWGGVCSILLSLLLFVCNHLVETMLDHMETIESNSTDLVLLKQKIEDDDSQWQILKAQDDTIQELKLNVRILEEKHHDLDSSGSKEINIKVDLGNISLGLKDESVQQETTIPQSDEVSIPPSGTSQAELRLEELRKEEEQRLAEIEDEQDMKKTLEERQKNLEKQEQIERAIKELEESRKREDYKDFRNSKMLEQRAR